MRTPLLTRRLTLLATTALAVALLVVAAQAALVVVTAPTLLGDASYLACPGDRVVSVVPPGADIHTYQLTPRDAKLIEEADVVITTGHTAVDRAAEELARGVVVDMLRVPGVKLLRLPSGAVDPHMPVYYPPNYAAFMRAVASAMGEANPVCRGWYEARLHELLAWLNASLGACRGVVAGLVVGDAPYTLYWAAWVAPGAEVELAMPRPGVVSAKAVEDAARAELVLATWPPVSAATTALLSNARRAALVPSPAQPSPVYSKLVAACYSTLAALQSKPAAASTRGGGLAATLATVLGGAAALAWLLLLLLRGRRGVAATTRA